MMMRQRGSVAPVVTVLPPSGYKLRQRHRIDDWELARLIGDASLHAIDRYFMQVRREISELEWWIPHFIVLLASACEIAGQVEEAVTLLDEALTLWCRYHR